MATRKVKPKAQMANDLTVLQDDDPAVDATVETVGEWNGLAKVREIAARVKASPRVSRVQKETAPQQMPFWPDDKRALPNDLARGALFSVSKDDARAYYKSIKVHSLAGIDIIYKGEELRQDDLSVLLTVIHLYRQQKLGDAPVEFTVYSILKELGWSHNTAEYEHLRECFERLSANNVKVAAQEGRRGYSASLVRKYEWKDENNKTLARWRVWLEPSIINLFDDKTYTHLQWSERKVIGHRAPLALWLHAMLSTHRQPHPYSVAKYRELCGSKAKTLFSFREGLKRALRKLVDIGFLENFEITPGDLVMVSRAPDAKRLKSTEKSKAKRITKG